MGYYKDLSGTALLISTFGGPDILWYVLECIRISHTRIKNSLE